MSTYLAESISILADIQTVEGVPETLGGSNALAVVDLELTTEVETKESTFSGKPDRIVNTYVADKTSSVSFSTYFPAYHEAVPTLYTILEAANASTVQGTFPLVKATNALTSCEEATLQILQHQMCDLGDDKSKVVWNAGAVVDLEIEVDTRAIFKFSWQGEYSSPTDQTALDLDFGNQKNYLAPALTQSNLIRAKLQPENSPDVGNINICFGKVSITNLFGQKIERYKLSCEKGFARSVDVGEVKLTILEDDMLASYSPETMLEKYHSLTLEWGVVYLQGVTFSRLQLVNFAKTDLGVWAGYELTFKNVGTSEVYNLVSGLQGHTPIDNNSWSYGFIDQDYSATFTHTGGFGTAQWTATGLPTDLTLDIDTGVLSGTIQEGEEGTSTDVQITVTKGEDVYNFTLFDFVITTESQFPIAVDDEAIVLPESVSLIDVLSNDSNGLGIAILDSIISFIGDGSAQIIANQIEYTAPSGEGSATITYKMSDGLGNYDIAVLEVTSETSGISAKGWRWKNLRPSNPSNHPHVEEFTLKNAVGTIVSDVSDGGLIFGTGPLSGDSTPTKAFDLADPDYWNSPYSGSYIGRILVNPVIVKTYTVQGNIAGDPHVVHLPHTWEFEYSINSTTGIDGDWVNLDFQTGLTWIDDEVKTFTDFND